MRYSFFALISRMKNITRWSLMRNSAVENIQEHSHMVAVIAHALAVIRRDVFGKASSPGDVAAAALFHDASEIFTGDMPTPIKYFDPEILSAYKKIESLAAQKLLRSLPEKMRSAYQPLLSDEGDAETMSLISAADKLAAYIKCLEELKAGNMEFEAAAKQSKEKLSMLKMPEVDYFVENFITSFELTLDELDFNFGA